MNIVHVVESMAVGGLERVVLLLAGWQRAQGDAVRILCLFDEGALAAPARAAGVPLEAIGKRSGWDARAMRAVRAAVRATRPDVLHTHNAMAHYYAVAATLGLGVPRVVNTRHGMGAPAASRREQLYRLALRGTDAVAFVSQPGRALFVEASGAVPARKAHVVANGADIDAIAPRSMAARIALLEQLGRPAGTPLVGTVGRLDPVKDHPTLLGALAQLRAAGSAAELVVVGDGATRPDLEARAASAGLAAHVHFLGMRADVHALLPAFDVFALSSISEGYSLALVEAAAAALPLVATRVGGNGDIVAEGVNGILVEPRDPAALAGAIGRLLDDPALARRMGAAGRDWALRHGSVAAMGAAYRALYAPAPEGRAQ